MKEKVALVRGARARHGLAAALRAVGLARSTWYYQTRIRRMYAEKYAHLEAPLKAIGAAGTRANLLPRRDKAESRIDSASGTVPDRGEVAPAFFPL